jgi:hypothetical protein
MSRIEFEQISEDEIEVILPPETPLEMVEQIKKSFVSKGLVEDLSKSTVSVRYFFRPQDDVNRKADELIKSLNSLIKDNESPSERRKRSIAESQGIKYEPNKLVPNIKQSTTGFRSITNPTAPKKQVMNTFKAEDEHGENCECEQCQIEKSGYGPKKAGLYNPADNARRKARNTTDQIPSATNRNVKAFSTKPAQLSGKQQADALARKQAALNRKQPVRTMKDMSPEELAALTAKNLKKSWADHLPFPNAEEEMEKIKDANPVERAENLMAGQLANLMNNKAMLNPLQRQPTSEDMIMAGERMGLGAANEEVIKSQDQQWGSAINDFYREASKPISQRFSSEEEEIAYWNSIKVSGGRDNGEPGY